MLTSDVLGGTHNRTGSSRSPQEQPRQGCDDCGTPLSQGDMSVGCRMARLSDGARCSRSKRRGYVVRGRYRRRYRRCVLERPHSRSSMPCRITGDGVRSVTSSMDDGATEVRVEIVAQPLLDGRVGQPSPRDPSVTKAVRTSKFEVGAEEGTRARWRTRKRAKPRTWGLDSARTRWSRAMVRKRGLEPPRTCGH